MRDDSRAARPDTATAALTSRPWDRLLDRALGRARRVPTMLTPQEQRLYYWLTAVWADGAGDVVDLGCFAGGSTARLAEGMAVAASTRKVHAYDRFTAGADVKQSILYRQGLPQFDGSDILPLAESLLAPWRDRVILHQGEIDRARWSGDPIELLVMDASKTAETMDRMSETFLPHLIPERSLLVQQDFLHWSQPWVPAQMELLSDHFVPVVHVPRDTVVFLCRRPPTPADVAAARTSALTDDQLLGHLVAAQNRYAAFGLSNRLRDMIRALRANGGKRKAYQFRRP